MTVSNYLVNFNVTTAGLFPRGSRHLSLNRMIEDANNFLHLTGAPLRSTPAGEKSIMFHDDSVDLYKNNPYRLVKD